MVLLMQVIWGEKKGRKGKKEMWDATLSGDGSRERSDAIVFATVAEVVCVVGNFRQRG